MLKMYILIKEDVPYNFVPVICAHASLACYLKYKDDSDMIEWSNSVFRKVIVKVNEKEFNMAKDVEKNIVLTESALQGKEVSIALSPREEFPKFIKFLRLFKFD